MHIVRDVAAVIERVAPLSLAEPWDNVGLLCGSYEARVESVTLALDATSQTIEQTVAFGSQLLVTHHPILFRPVQRLLDGQADADLLRLLIANRLSLYSAHTNLDRAPAIGTAWALASVLGLETLRPLPECSATSEIAEGAPEPSLGLLAQLAEPLTVRRLAEQVASTLGVTGVQLVGEPERSVSTLALVPGAGGELVEAACQAGAEVFLTGELKHHEMLLAASVGVTAIAAGHFATERPVIAVLARHLSQSLPGVTVNVATQSEPVRFLMPSDSGG